MAEIDATVESMIWANVMPEPNTGCWLWTGPLTYEGYGRLGRKSAHRISFFQHHPEADRALFVLHRCDQRSCVNPDHLFLGTHQENMQDMVAKNRFGKPRRKLTFSDAKAIRQDGRSHRLIAFDYGVDRRTISRVKSGTSWREN